MKDSQTLYRAIVEHFKSTNQKISDIGIFLRESGNKTSSARRVTENLRNNIVAAKTATVLVTIFKVPPSTFKDHIDKQLMTQLCKAQNGLEEIAYPCDIEKSSGYNLYLETLNKYLQQAKNTLYVSQFLPGVGPHYTPSEIYLEQWVKSHEAWYDAIIKRLEDCEELHYHRIFNIPTEIPLKRPGDAIWHTLLCCHDITFEHMKIAKEKFGSRVSFHAVPLLRQTSHVIIDNSLLLTESHIQNFDDDHPGLYQDVLRVERVTNNDLLTELLRHYNKAFKKYLNPKSEIRRESEIDLTSPNDLRDKFRKSGVFIEQRRKIIVEKRLKSLQLN
ncbi:MAG: hypothetical protein JJ975_05850 [Bacteroidia bacterium]|nr:hypothetical protein [Bacteroidia bacterium]